MGERILKRKKRKNFCMLPTIKRYDIQQIQSRLSFQKRKLHMNFERASDDGLFFIEDRTGVFL